MQKLNANSSILAEAESISNNADSVLAKFGYADAEVALA